MKQEGSIQDHQVLEQGFIQSRDLQPYQEDNNQENVLLPMEGKIACIDRQLVEVSMIIALHSCSSPPSAKTVGKVIARINPYKKLTENVSP